MVAKIAHLVDLASRLRDDLARCSAPAREPWFADAAKAHSLAGDILGGLVVLQDECGGGGGSRVRRLEDVPAAEGASD